MPIQSTPISKPHGYAIDYTEDSQTWQIKHVTISSQGTDAIRSIFDHSTLYNHGLVTSFSAYSSGVLFQGNHGNIVNFDNGIIDGIHAAVAISGDSDTIDNRGSIGGLASAAVIFGSPSTNPVLINSGTVFGLQSGVDVESNLAGGEIANTGVIHSVGDGILVDSRPSFHTVITNHGTIEGRVSAITTLLGGIDLTNFKTINGTIDLNADHEWDVVLNHGHIDGNVYLGAGDDTFQGFEGISGKIFGEAGKDVLIGSSHADDLNGGTGKDTLTGGGAADHFDFARLADSKVGALHDVITDFHHGQQDIIDLSTIDADAGVGGNQSFVFRGTQAFTGAGELRYVLENHAGTANDRTMIYASVDADHAPEFQIEVKGLIHFHAGDFVL